MEFVTKLKEKIVGLGLSKLQLGAIAACGVAVVGGGTFAVVSLATDTDDARANAGVTMSGSSAYMEETVSTGDIVVGISETATASMYEDEITYDFTVEVSEFYVKAGEDVVEGQAIALLDMDTVNEAKDELALEIADATTALAEAEADYDVQAIKAQETLELTNYNGVNADYLYAVALAEIDETYSQLSDTVDDRSVTLYYAYAAQSAGPSSTAKDNYYTAMNTAKTTYDDFCTNSSGYTYCILSGTSYTFATIDASKCSCQSDGSCGCNTSTTESTTTCSCTPTVIENSGNVYLCCTEAVSYNSYSEVATVKSQLNTIYNDAASDYSTACTSYESAQASLDAAVTTAYNNYVDANDAYTEYGAAIEYYQIQAYADYQTNLVNYASANDVYANTMSMNENLVETAELALELLQTEYEAYDELPADGIVTATSSGYIMRLADVDTEYDAGYTLAVIGSDQSVEIWVSISQDDIADIAIGMETNVIFDAYEEYTIPAVVESISTSSSSGMTSTVNYTLEISCDISDYPDIVVFDSMSATVTFVQRQESGVLMVSSKCITTEDGVSYVKMLDDNGDIMYVEVETGFSDGFDVEIVSGIEEGDVVIIESAVG